VKRFARGLLAAIFAVEKAIAYAGFAVMAGALIADVLSREITGTGLFGAQKIGVFGLVAVAFIGIGIASQTGSHLRPRFADRLVPRAWDAALDRIADAVFALFCAGFAGLAIAVMQESRALDDVAPVLRWPVWPFQGLIAVAFGIAVIRHGLFAVYPDLRPPSGGGDAPQSPEGPPLSMGDSRSDP
jgi:TRAP-type C4-dicarboxylate transport system permease small subunit